MTRVLLVPAWILVACWTTACLWLGAVTIHMHYTDRRQRNEHRDDVTRLAAILFDSAAFEALITRIAAGHRQGPIDTALERCAKDRVAPMSTTSYANVAPDLAALDALCPPELLRRVQRGEHPVAPAVRRRRTFTPRIGGE